MMDLAVVMVLTLTMFEGLVKGIFDRVSEGDFLNTYWNKAKGHKLKWKTDEDGDIISPELYTMEDDKTNGKRHWWYLGLYKPNNIEAFPFSSTILVFTTDGWHLLQFIMYRLNDLKPTMLLVMLYGPWFFLTIPVLWIVRGIFFEATHE